jgi:hypothetical protein
MSVSTVAALVLQASSPQNLTCTLVTPDATAVQFSAPDWNPAARALSVVRSGASTAWPQQSLEGKAEGSSGHSFSFGGSEGLLLELGQTASGSGTRTALLSRRARGSTAHPVAFGYCSSAPAGGTPVAQPPAAAAGTGADAAAFDPARWPEDCALVTDGGDILRFDYTIEGGRVALDSTRLWGGRRVLVPIAFTDKGARFGSRDGPSGSERFTLDRRSGRAVKLIHFSRLADSTGRSAYGICGYNQVVRRPNVK